MCVCVFFISSLSGVLTGGDMHILRASRSSVRIGGLTAVEAIQLRAEADEVQCASFCSHCRLRPWLAHSGGRERERVRRRPDPAEKDSRQA
jgi:hypothetical protein